MNYKVPFVNFQLHYHRMESEIDAAIKEVLNGGDYIMRQQLCDFEDNLASFVGVKYAVGLNSGTDAIHLSLLAAGIKPGDEVITVAHTFVATVATIVHCGAKPVLVDVDRYFNMDVTKLEPAISPQTKAIIPVHLNGRLCDMEKLMDIARKHNLVVIEDAAQALGARFEGQKAGSFGLTGCFSFYPAKVLGSLGDGGAVVTNSSEIAERIRLLRDHGQQRATGDILFYGYNSRLDNLQAAILVVKLKHLPDWIERRRELAMLYEKGLSDLPQVQTPPPPQEGHYFDIFTNYVIYAEERDSLVDYLRDCGIEILVSWPKPMHHHEALGLEHFHLPETERISREVLSLPLNTEISNEQAQFVIESVQKFYSK
ncbi:MAG: DegT/DnrJ/EryC1/StrS family aminotransferase [Dehalococcoidales bacterium]|nr:DegT/DnrJ/EryC1/StrS family aminotransferase [Dehalococcoidales bacterium]